VSVAPSFGPLPFHQKPGTLASQVQTPENNKSREVYVGESIVTNELKTNPGWRQIMPLCASDWLQESGTGGMLGSGSLETERKERT
jgi:hypothetical protein